MRFRRYTPADLEAMFQLDLACFTPPYQFDREMMRESAEAPNAIIVVIEKETSAEMLGFLIAHPQGKGRNRFAYIVTIDVAPSARRTGIGAILLQQTEAQATATGLHSMGLHVAADNATAITFYQRQGYEQIGTEKNFYHEANTDAFIFVKPL